MPWVNHQEYDASLLLSSVTPKTNLSALGIQFSSHLTQEIPHYNGGTSLLIKGSFAKKRDAVDIPL